MDAKAGQRRDSDCTRRNRHSHHCDGRNERACALAAAARGRRCSECVGADPRVGLESATAGHGAPPRIERHRVRGSRRGHRVSGRDLPGAHARQSQFRASLDCARRAVAHTDCRGLAHILAGRRRGENGTPDTRRTALGSRVAAPRPLLRGIRVWLHHSRDLPASHGAPGHPTIRWSSAGRGRSSGWQQWHRRWWQRLYLPR